MTPLVTTRRLAHARAMPELPEVETVRRMLQAKVVGRRVARAKRSRQRLHVASRGTGLGRVEGRVLERVERRGKYLLFRFDRGVTMLSHLGMSGRWLFFDRAPAEALEHVHARLEFADGAHLWFQDPRRFGQLRVVADAAIEADESLAVLGRDPVEQPLSGSELAAMARGSTVAVKIFLLDQRRIAGIGNIYASEILFHAGVDPRRKAGRVTGAQWDAIAREIPAVLEAAIRRMGTTFRSYRTLANEPGEYSALLLVYDRAGQPCKRCGSGIRRLVQGARSTFYCPACQRGTAPAQPSRR
jgi:formamidopyrimidine-DNA glycosylase